MNNRPNPSELSVMAFCGGMGGAEAGAIKLGMRVKQTCEIDPAARTVLFRLLGKHPLEDLMELEPCNVPDVDGYIGGCPCQPFSQLGPMRKLDDPRWLLNIQPIRIAKKRRPKFLLFENVRQITERIVIDALNRELADAGYKPLQYCLLNTAHFGLETARIRCFWASFRRDIPSRYIHWPTDVRLAPGKLQNILLPDDRTNDLVVDSSRFVPFTPKMKRVDPYRPHQCGFIARNYQGRRVYLPDAPCPTYVSSTGGPGGSSGLYLINGRIRQLHALEQMAAMGFSKSHPMPFRRTVAGRLIGNSLSPVLASACLIAVINAMTAEGNQP